MPSQRERSITAGFIGGFFGQKNKNTEARRVQQERMEELQKTMELERSKTKYNAAQEEQNKGNTFYKTVQASGGTKQDGTLNASGLTLAAQHAFGNAWNNMKPSAQNEWLLEAEKEGKTLEQWRNSLFGNMAKYDKVASSMGTSPHKNVGKASDNIVAATKAKAAMTTGNVTPPVTPNEPAGIQDGPSGVLGGIEKKVLREVEIKEDGVRKLKVFYTDDTYDVLEIGGDKEDPEVKRIAQPYVDLDTNEPISVFWKTTDKGEPEVWGVREDGTKTFNVRPETDPDAQERVSNVPLREQASEMVLYRNNFEGIKTVKDMAMTFNPADKGVQGLGNSVSAYLDFNINPLLSVERGEANMLKVAEALGIQGVTSEEEAASAVKKQETLKMQESLFSFIDDEFSPEVAGELKQMARGAANNVYKTTLIYLVAKSLRGEGKLNTSDIEMVKGLIADDMGEAAFLGSLATINDMLVTKARSGARRLIDDYDQKLSDAANQGSFFESKDSDEGRMGILYKAHKSGSKDPVTGDLRTAYVYVDGETGNIREIKTPEDLSGFLNNMKKSSMFSINFRE